MENNINYGSIYETSYWGIGVTDGSGNWGESYIDLANNLIPSILSSLKSRATYYENEANTIELLQSLENSEE